jgi:hypothetical protein
METHVTKTAPPALTGNRLCDRIIESRKQASSHQPKSTEEWRQWWMKRYSYELAGHTELSDGKRRMYWAIVNVFLFENPGSPRTISIERTVEFVYPEPDKRSAPLILFYSTVIDSPKHVKAIKGTPPNENLKTAAAPPPRPVNSPGNAVTPQEDTTPASPPYFAPLLEALRKELSARNYSRRTIGNYRRVVRNFLRWLSAPPAPDDAPRVMQYNLYLKEQSSFAPRTINLYSAAISFFYRFVVKTDNITENVPRMKIGKPLPKVYSERQIEKMIAATTNPKHRLAIMLAYGAGLRLGEIRLLRRQHIDFDKDCIRISRLFVYQ